jgi:hypothetical protein
MQQSTRRRRFLMSVILSIILGGLAGYGLSLLMKLAGGG